MDRRDYIMTMIEQLGRMLAAIRRGILGGDTTRAETGSSLREVARLGGLDYELAQAMSPETLLMMVAPGGEVDPGRCWLLAELSYLDGVEAELADEIEEAVIALQRAGHLFGLLQPITGNFHGVPESADRLLEVQDRLARLARLDGGSAAGGPAETDDDRSP